MTHWSDDCPIAEYYDETEHDWWGRAPDSEHYGCRHHPRHDDREWVAGPGILMHTLPIEEDTWCNCQAIPGTQNYPGPWHERAGEPHYPCYSDDEGTHDAPR